MDVVAPPHFYRRHQIKGGAFFVDIIRAFPTLSHRNIRRFLQRNGAPDWYTSISNKMYTDMVCLFSFGGERGRVARIIKGLTQGNPVSALLFMIYAQSLVSLLLREIRKKKHEKVRAFADDMALIPFSLRYVAFMQHFPFSTRLEEHPVA